MSAMFSLAQEDTLATAIKIKLPNSDFKAKALVSEIEISIVPTKDSIVIPKIDIKSDHWDITTYNPYKDAIVQYPLKLNFTDSTYTSPVSHNKVITSRYGWRRGRPHKGIDIDLVTGDSVVSILDGIVRIGFDEQIYCDVKYSVTGDLYDPQVGDEKTLRYACYRPSIIVDDKEYKYAQPTHGLFLADTTYPMTKTKGTGINYKTPVRVI